MKLGESTHSVFDHNIRRDGRVWSNACDSKSHGHNSPMGSNPIFSANKKAPFMGVFLLAS